jgi:pimeloyl-ACP methyl ester carboxylesterase
LEDAVQKTIFRGDVRLCAETFGKPGDPAIVLVMGATASMFWWPETLCRLMADQGRLVIRYDHRDTGRSSTWPVGAPGYAVEDLAEDMIAVLDDFELEKADVFGMSLGGLIGQMVAIRWPQRIRSLILIGCEPLGWTGPDLPGIAPHLLDHFAGMADLDWQDRTAVAEFMLEIARQSAGSREDFDETAELQRIDAELDRAADIRTAFNHASLELRDDWSGQLAAIGQPVLVLHGEEDAVLPLPNGKALAGAISNAQLVVLPGVGHELPKRALSQIAESIDRFLANIE